jgi:hypothetical protein
LSNVYQPANARQGYKCNLSPPINGGLDELCAMTKESYNVFIAERLRLSHNSLVCRIDKMLPKSEKIVIFLKKTCSINELCAMTKESYNVFIAERLRLPQ